MFRLFDRTRRRICRVLFVGLCVLPTAAIIVWGTARHWPGHAQNEARRLARRLGVAVSCRDVEHLAPGRVCYCALRLSDPETGQTLLTCERLDAIVETDHAGATTLQLRPRGLELDGPGLLTLATLLRRSIGGEALDGPTEVTLTAGDVVIHEGEQLWRLSDCEGSLQSHPGGSQARWRFRMADSAAGEPAQFQLTRNRQTEPATTAVKIYSGGGALPCRLLGFGLPVLRHLGESAAFRGYLWASRSAGSWSGQLTGQFNRIELARLVDAHFPHTLRATADIAIQDARFDGGRLIEATGALTTGPGLIGRSLLGALVAELGLVQPSQPATPNDPIPFEQLGVHWRLADDGLTLHGGCTVAGPGTILIDRRHRLLGDPIVQPQPVAALVRMLVPTDAEAGQVPAARQSAWLLSRLPLGRHAGEAPATDVGVRLSRGRTSPASN